MNVVAMHRVRLTSVSGPEDFYCDYCEAQPGNGCRVLDSAGTKQWFARESHKNRMDKWSGYLIGRSDGREQERKRIVKILRKTVKEIEESS